MIYFNKKRLEDSFYRRFCRKRSLLGAFSSFFLILHRGVCFVNSMSVFCPFYQVFYGWARRSLSIYDMDIYIFSHSS